MSDNGTIQSLITTTEIDWDAPIEAQGWRNLYFSKCGRSHFGEYVYRTEKEASGAASYCIKKFSEEGVLWPCGRIQWSDTSHAIQMPVKS